MKKLIRNYASTLVMAIITLTGSWGLSNELTGSLAIYSLQDSKRFQEILDVTFRDLFQSALKEQLCAYSRKTTDWQVALGVSEDVIENSLKTCTGEFPKRRKSNFPEWPFQGKLIPKRYFLISDERKSSLVESWTDNQNSTFFIIAPELGELDFKLMIAHELAMTLDSKNNMDMRTFSYNEDVGPTFEFGFHYQNSDLQHSPVLKLWPAPFVREGGNFQVQIQAMSLISGITKVMNLASTTKYARIFSVMRAFNVEKILQGKSPTSMQNHQACVDEFKQVSQNLELLEAEVIELSKNQSNETLWDMYKQHMDHEFSVTKPEEESRIRDLMMSPDFFLPLSSRPRFCEYMSTPTLSGIKYNMFSTGPRPRFTGGAGEYRKTQKPDFVTQPSGQPQYSKNQNLFFGLSDLSLKEPLRDPPKLDQDFLKFLNTHKKEPQ